MTRFTDVKCDLLHWKNVVEIDLFEFTSGKVRYISHINTELAEAFDVGMPDHDPEPLIIEMAAAQSLMNQLWNCGIRPTEADSVGALEQAERHIETLKQVNNSLLELLKNK